MTTKEKAKSEQGDKMPILANLTRPNKVDKYQEFILWFAMPTPERMQLGIETQKEWAEFYHVAESTLVRWKDRPDFEVRVDHIQSKWGVEKTADVIQGIYRSAVKGNPMSQLLWLQYFKKFSPKTTVETTVKHEITVNDIRFLINGLPEDLRKKHNANLRTLLDDVQSVRDSGLLEDGGGGHGSEGDVSDTTDTDAQDVQREATDDVPGSDQEGVRTDMVRGLQSYHHQSAAWWRQEQAPGNSRLRSLVLTETEGS